jgi:O-antigen/teichoic acid export membrane protein
MRGALPMAAGGLVLTMLAQTGVIILELNHPDEAVVSAYAVAFQTGTFVVILATATNRLYAPRISALLDRGDFQALRAMARYRLLVIAPLTLCYLFVILAFGPTILSLFGEKYSTEFPALCFIAIGASVSTIFSLSPTYMHFTNRDRIVLAALVASVVLNLALCVPLSDRYGALGAAIAYAAPVSLLHVGLWLFELYNLVRYKLAMWHARIPGLTR